MDKAGLCLERLRIGLNGDPMIAIDAEIAPGEVLTVMGASGSGKSTLIGAIAGFVRPVFSVSGRILIDGEDISNVPPEQRHMGLLFQDPMLFPHFSVLQNILYALPPGGSRAERCGQAETLLASVDLEGFGPRDTATLSGGQQAPTPGHCCWTSLSRGSMRPCAAPCGSWCSPVWRNANFPLCWSLMTPEMPRQQAVG